MAGAKGRWVEAKDVLVGDQVRLGDDQVAAVKEIAAWSEVLTVYNLTVEGEHTFAVGEPGVLVHNTCAQGWISKFRERAGLPAFAAGDSATGTAAMVVGNNGRRYFGVSSGFASKRGATAANRRSFMDFVFKRAGRPRPGNAGDAIPFWHAEAQALERAARRGGLSGDVTIHVDRVLCNQCGGAGGLEAAARALGLDSLSVLDSAGTLVRLY